MKDYFLIFLVFILIYFFLIYNQNNNTTYIEAKSGTKYLIHNDKFTKEKANLLSTIVEKMFILKNHLIKNIDNFPEYRYYIKQLDDNFTQVRTTIYETDPLSELTSYSVNKGEELAFCLKSKKDDKLHDINLLMYVAIHEMAHFACPEIGHGELFKKIFKKFIEEAIKIKLYTYVDYEVNPVEYCGMILSSSIV